MPTANSQQPTANSQQPKFYYVFTYFHSTGGDYVNLDHIRTLRSFGIDARILFLGADLALFQQAVHDLPIDTADALHNGTLKADDIVIVPEVYRFMFDGTVHLPDNRLIMHNQNTLQTWNAFDSAKDLNRCGNLHSLIVPSRYSEKKLREMGVNKPVHVLYPYLPDYFYPREKSRRPIKIVYSARKRRHEVPILWFYFRSFYTGSVPVELVNLEGLPRERVAEEMGSAAIFASFAERESVGLMALEAMASGCRVVGFSGYTDFENNDFFNGSNGSWVQEGEYRRFAECLCTAVEDFITHGSDTPAVRNGLNLIEQHFRRPHFERDLYALFQSLLAADA